MEQSLYVLLPGHHQTGATIPLLPDPSPLHDLRLKPAAQVRSGVVDVSMKTTPSHASRLLPIAIRLGWFSVDVAGST
jgi:hypothetical protein